MAKEKRDVDIQAALDAVGSGAAAAAKPEAPQAPAEAQPAPAAGDQAQAAAGAGAAPAEGARKPRVPHGKGFRAIASGIAHIRATFNNTIISITDTRGAVIAWSSSGRSGFKGSRKSTAFAATVVGKEVARQAVARGMQEVEVRVQGPGAGRESAIRALQSSGLLVSSITDVTPVPHNGCRPRKRRRV